MTQPQGHSTSGSHERYKPKERLDWEQEYDCIKKMKSWILETAVATKEEIETIEKNAVDFVKVEQRRAWTDYTAAFDIEKKEAITHILDLKNESARLLANELKTSHEPTLKDIYGTDRKSVV